MRKHNQVISKTIVVATLLTFFLLSLQSTATSDIQNNNPRIFVVNYPLQYFAQRIGGDKVDVFFPAPSDVDPAYWTPSRDVVAQYQKADLILLNGANYAKWTNKVSLPKSKLVDTSQSFKKEYIQLKSGVTHSHGPSGKHVHKGIAFTTWLDPVLAVKQAESIKNAFIEILPEDKEYFTSNYELLKSDLEKLNRNINSIVAKDPTKPLIASHPVYQYLARQYNLNIKSVHWEPDQVIGPEELQELDSILGDHSSDLMVWEDKPTEETLKLLTSRGIQSVVFNPCFNKPENSDYLEIMNSNISNLKPAY